jgi:CheY-like chemotaxis protein
MTLPLAEAGVAPAREIGPSGISLAAQPTGQTVLLVEDEQAVRVTSKRLLERGGFTVLIAENGVEAWRLFLEHIDSVDVVVTDLMMPELSGRELVHRIRANVPDMPVVITSAYSPDDKRASGPVDTVDATLVKPFTGAVLVQTVREVLAQRQRRDRLRPPAHSAKE